VLKVDKYYLVSMPSVFGVYHGICSYYAASIMETLANPDAIGDMSTAFGFKELCSSLEIPLSEKGLLDTTLMSLAKSYGMSHRVFPM